MATVKAAVENNLYKAAVNAHGYLHLSSILGPLQEAWRSGTKLQALRQHALDLAREEITIDLEQLGRAESGNDDLSKRKKDNILKRMQNLAPG